MNEKRNLFEKSLNLFTLNRVDRDIYSWNGKNVGWGRVFGGQVMAQTLIAAYKTIDVEHYAHSFHSYFLRPGDMDKPIIFTVDRIRNGKSFTTYAPNDPNLIEKLSDKNLTKIEKETFI